MLNKDNSTIRYYKGIIREITAQLKNAIARIKKLEDKVRKIPLNSTHNPSNMELFANDDINRGILPAGTTTGSGTGGFTEAEIKAMVSQWIENGELPVTIHDHTDINKGGDAYANKGAALQ